MKFIGEFGQQVDACPWTSPDGSLVSRHYSTLLSRTSSLAVTSFIDLASGFRLDCGLQTVTRLLSHAASVFPKDASRAIHADH